MKETYLEDREIICTGCNAYVWLTNQRVECATPPKLEDGTICPCYQCIVKPMCNTDCETWTDYYDYFKERYEYENERDAQEREEERQKMHRKWYIRNKRKDP